MAPLTKHCKTLHFLQKVRYNVVQGIIFQKFHVANSPILTLFGYFAASSYI